MEAAVDSARDCTIAYLEGLLEPVDKRSRPIAWMLPYKRIRRWSWEIFWLAGGIFSWILAPWVFAALRTHELLNVLASTPVNVLFWVYFWGVMWGLGDVSYQQPLNLDVTPER